jgi:enoyl-CoA hydratase
LDYQTIRFEKGEMIAVLTLIRPDKLNAIDHVMLDELGHVQKRLSEDDATRVLVITGEGRGFCSGLDLTDKSLMNPEGGYDAIHAYAAQQRFSKIIVGFRQIPQPIVAAVNGPAAGGGLSIALASDVRFASTNARFSAAYINLGVGGADLGSSWFLPRLVGHGFAARYIYTGDIFAAEEAYRIGLIQGLYEPEELMDAAMGLALNSNAGATTLEQAVRVEDRNQALCIMQLAMEMEQEKK